MESDLSLLCRNAVEVISKEELRERLAKAHREKKPLRIKAGFDPSAPDIHLGHTVLLRKLRQFQDLGHKVIFIIGDTTAMIGDPSGRTKVRAPLSKEEVAENAKTYQSQAFKILDKDPKKIQILRNSQWLDGGDMFRIFFEKIGSRSTVDQLLERKDFDQRRKAHRPITLREFIYPLLQGYDSVQVKSDVELGGTDQKFNLLMGRDLQSEFGQRPQVVMTLPLLVGLDGVQKMSKSLGNHIGLADPPKEMYGKLMSIPDSLMESYFNLLTSTDGRTITQKIEAGTLHPRDAKAQLAAEIVGGVYGTSMAQKQALEFDRVFKHRQNPEEPELCRVTEPSMWIVELMRRSGTVSSGSQARRLIAQGAVWLDGSKIADPDARVKVHSGSLLKVGKTRFVKLVFLSKSM